MKRRTQLLSLCAIAATATTLAIANPSANPSDNDGATQPQPELPPGWTMDDMMACVQAGTPGEMQAHLSRWVGNWYGKGQMTMGPGGPETPFDCTTTITSIMDGRYTQVEMAADLPGMGPYTGAGVNGYDNMREAFVSTWIDNHSTGIMNGKGTRSADGKTMTWEFEYICPVTKKPATLRQIDRFTGDNTMTFEMHGQDPKSGKAYRMMKVEYTRQS